jgi:hypothetical protein
MEKPQPKKHTGSCHCGVLKFEATLDLAAGGARCNCSICTKLGGFGAIIKPDAFTLLTDEKELSSYVWGGNISRRFFCPKCGAHCFGRGHLAEVGGDFVSVNLNCLDGVELAGLPTIYWDGRHDNWQAGPRPEPWPILPA